MLGLIFIYFIGRAFYRLALEYGKSKWLWPILGVASYYIFGFLFGVIIALLDLMWILDNDGLVMLIGLGAGIGGTIILYRVLNHVWKKEALNKADIEILDQ
jgi:Na+-driven multidrug efflux pump